MDLTLERGLPFPHSPPGPEEVKEDNDSEPLRRTIESVTFLAGFPRHGCSLWVFQVWSWEPGDLLPVIFYQPPACRAKKHESMRVALKHSPGSRALRGLCYNLPYVVPSVLICLLKHCRGETRWAPLGREFHWFVFR